MARAKTLRSTITSNSKHRRRHSTKGKKKYYAVKLPTGLKEVFMTWRDSEIAVNGVSRARRKGFNEWQDATAWLEQSSSKFGGCSSSGLCNSASSERCGLLKTRSATQTVYYASISAFGTTAAPRSTGHATCSRHRNPSPCLCRAPARTPANQSHVGIGLLRYAN